MSPPRPELFTGVYASLWDLLPQTLHEKLNSGDISANVLINTLGQKINNLSSFRYVTFVKKMIESNAIQADLAGENYRLDNILDTFARDSSDNLNPTDFTPITKFLEWNIFDASNSYLGGFANYLQGPTPFKRASLAADMDEAKHNNKSFFAVLVLGQVPIQTILTEYYPQNTYTEFVQSVVDAGTDRTSAINSNPYQNDQYGRGRGVDPNNIDPTAFNPYQYNFGNLRLGIDYLPSSVKAIDMWAAATPQIDMSGTDMSGNPYNVAIPANWDKWLADVNGFLEFIRLAFLYYKYDDDAKDAPIIQEFASTAEWNSKTQGYPPGFEKEFKHWLTGGYNASWTNTVSNRYSYSLNNLSPSTYEYPLIGETKSYELIYDINGAKSFVITVITLLRAGVDIDIILNAFVTESAPSMFYKGYAPAQYLRYLCYTAGKITFSKLIAYGDASGLYHLLDLDSSQNELGHDFTDLTHFDPYILLYAENDFSGNGNIFTYTPPSNSSLTGQLRYDMSNASFKSNGNPADPPLKNEITKLIYDNVYMRKIYTNSSLVNGYTFIRQGAVDACGNTVTPICLDRGRKIRLDELRTLVGYAPEELADENSYYLEANGPFTITDFVNENYSTKNGGPSTHLFDCYSVYGYSLSQIYNDLSNNYYSANGNKITQSLRDLADSSGNSVYIGSDIYYDLKNNTATKFTDFDLIYYLRQDNDDIESIADFFPALSYDRIRNTYFDFSNNNSTAFTWRNNRNNLTGNPVISIDTLTDYGAYLKFLSASDRNIKNINNANINHEIDNPYANSTRGGTIYDMLTMISDFSEYTPTDIAYYVLTLPKSPLSNTSIDVSGDFSQAAKLHPIDLLKNASTNSSHVDGSYSVFTKVELNGLYATDYQDEVRDSSGVVIIKRGSPETFAIWDKLSINTFLPRSTDYPYLLYGTNIGADSSNNGIRGILESINDFSNNNATDIAYLCCALEVSNPVSDLVVPHDIGPNGSIKDSENNLFTRDEIRQLTFPTTTQLTNYNASIPSSVNVTSIGNGLFGISPSDLVKISAWDVYSERYNNGYDYVYDHDYSLLNINDQFGSNNLPIKDILHGINGYGTTTTDATLYKNIAIALNNIWKSNSSDAPPSPVELFDGEYYTRDEIRTLFVNPGNKVYQLTFDVLTQFLNFETSYDFYKLAYATDGIDASGYYSTTDASNVKQILNNNDYNDASGAQIIRKMIYSKDYQTKQVSGNYNVDYLVQPWQLVNNFGFDANIVTQLPSIPEFNVYVNKNTTATAQLDSVETILINLYRNPANNYSTTNTNQFSRSDSQEFYYEYTLYRLNTVFKYNGGNYLSRIIGVFLPLDLSPRRLAIELRLGAYNDSSYSNVDGYYSFSDVYDALNNSAFEFSHPDFMKDPSEARNKAIYTTNYSKDPASSYKEKSSGSTVTDASINLYHSNSSVQMWADSDWLKKFFDNYTGYELYNTYKFTYDDIRGYFFDSSNTYFNAKGGSYTFSPGKFLTYGTFMTNLLFTRDVDPTNATPIAIKLLEELYPKTDYLGTDASYSDLSGAIHGIASSTTDANGNAKSIVTNNTEKIMQYLYYNTSNLYSDYKSDTQIYGVYGNIRPTTIKDVEYAAMGDISSNIVNVDIKIEDRVDMTNTFSINAMYNEVISAVTGSMVVNDFYHYYHRKNLHDFVVGEYYLNGSAIESDLLDISSVIHSSFGNRTDISNITIDYFTLSELAKDNTIPLSIVASNYKGEYQYNESEYTGSPYALSNDSAKIPYLYGTITVLNTRKPTGYELWFDGSYNTHDNWSAFNIRKLYYDISGGEFTHATGRASTRYISFENLVGAVYPKYDVSGAAAINPVKGDYSLVYAQDFELKTDMSSAFTDLSAIKILYEGSPEYNEDENTNSHSEKQLGFVYKTNGNIIGDRLLYDEIRTIVGFAGTRIKNVYGATIIVPEADIEPSQISTAATNNYWVSGTPYDSKWMTLKYAYEFNAIEIAQYSNTVIGKDLLNNPKTNNDGFSARDTRIGFLYGYSYFTSSNTGDSSNNYYLDDVGFTKYLSDPEFEDTSIAKFAQMVNNGEIASMNAKDKDGAYLIPAYSTAELTDDEIKNNTTNNVCFHNLFKYLLALYNSVIGGEITSDLSEYIKGNAVNNFVTDLNGLEDPRSNYSDIKYGNVNQSSVTDEDKTRIQIAMFIKFRLEDHVAPNYHNHNFVKNFFYSYLKNSPISIIDDYYGNLPINDIQAYKILYLQNLFSSADLFRIQTIPAIWNNGMGFTVKDIVEFYESEKNVDNTPKYRDSDIFSILYPYIPLEYLLSYRTYHVDASNVISDSGQSASQNKHIYYYHNLNPSILPSDGSGNYLPGTRWISVATALKGMDGLWGVKWDTNSGYYYTDKNSDAPSVDQVLAALSIIDSNSATSGVYNIDSTNNIVSYSYDNLDSSSNVIVEIRDAFLVTDGSHPAVCGYGKREHSNELTTFPTSTTAVSRGLPTINQLVALLNGQNIPLGFAKLIFVRTIIIRASIYTRAEKRGLFAGNPIITAGPQQTDGGLADAYYQLSQLVSYGASYENTPSIVYYREDHVVEDLISLKFPIDAYFDFYYNKPITNANSTTSPNRINIPSPVGLSENPFTTYGLLTAYDTNIVGYDNDGFAINVTGQLIWHTVAERNSIIDTFEASEYKYNPAGDNSGNLPYGDDSSGNYFYAYPENILSLRDAYRIELRNQYKADTKFGMGMSNDPNLNILVALKAIGIPRTIGLKFPVTAYSPFCNRNIGGDLTRYEYIRGTNRQSSVSTKDYYLGKDRKLLNFTAYELLSAFESEQIDSDENGFVFTSQNHLLWSTLSERDEIIDAFSDLDQSESLLKYNPATGTYGKDANGHYYFSYPANLNDFGDLMGVRSTP
jgi:hypothetical protein